MSKEITTTQPEITVSRSIFLDMDRFANAQRVATLLASSDLVPSHFQGKVANCVIALNLADRLGLDPFMCMQNIYVVHGRPGIEGKMAIALVEGTGRFSPIKFKMVGSGKTEKGVARPDSCVAYATELRTKEIVEGPPVTWEMAVAEGWTKPKKDQLSKWQTMPDLMFRYRAAMFFARVNCPGALLGLQTAEEIEDIEMVQTSAGYEAGGAPFDVEQPDETEETLKQFEVSIPADTDTDMLDAFIAGIASRERCTADTVKIEAMKQPSAFWGAFEKYVEKNKKSDPPPPEPEHEERFECPQGGYVTASICRTCEKLVDKSGERCPAAPVE